MVPRHPGMVTIRNGKDKGGHQLLIIIVWLARAGYRKNNGCLIVLFNLILK